MTASISLRMNFYLICGRSKRLVEDESGSQHSAVAEISLRIFWNLCFAYSPWRVSSASRKNSRIFLMHIWKQKAYTKTGTLYRIPYFVLGVKRCRREKRKNIKKGLTKWLPYDIIIWQHGRRYAGMAELADARDLKSREIFSRTGSIPASGTIFFCQIYVQFYIAG